VKPNLKRVFGSKAGLLDAHHLQHAGVLDLMQHELIIKVHLLLQTRSVSPYFTHGNVSATARYSTFAIWET